MAIGSAVEISFLLEEEINLVLVSSFSVEQKVIAKLVFEQLHLLQEDSNKLGSMSFLLALLLKAEVWVLQRYKHCQFQKQLIEELECQSMCSVRKPLEVSQMCFRAFCGVLFVMIIKI
jgi:hypothetical protein